MSAVAIQTGSASSREQLIDNALVLFAERGFRGVSVSELAQSCGLAKSTVLHHFSSKGKLYSAVLDRIDQGLAQTATSVMSTSGDLRQKVGQMINGLLCWSCEQPQHACLVVFELLELRSRERHPSHWNLAPAVKVFLELIEEAQAADMVYPGEAAAVLELILGATTYRVLSQPVTAAMAGRPFDKKFAAQLNADVITLLERAVIKPV